jgi:hypothetical protein
VAKQRTVQHAWADPFNSADDSTELVGCSRDDADQRQLQNVHPLLAGTVPCRLRG